MEIVELQYGNCSNLVSHIFGKNFVKVNNVFTKVIAIELI